MRLLILAVALGFFAVMALVETTAEPETSSSLAAATLPDADPVIVKFDTSKPFDRDDRDGVVSGPPTRRFTDI